MSINRGVDKGMWYIYTIEYYLAIKKNEIMPFKATWMHLESVILSEVSQTETIGHNFNVACISFVIWFLSILSFYSFKERNTYLKFLPVFLHRM